MNLRFTAEEFERLMEPWADEERSLVLARMRPAEEPGGGALTGEELQTLGTVIARLIPQSEGVDVPRFVAKTLNDPLGRGDRQEGVPPDEELIPAGLRALRSAGFEQMAPEQRDDVLRCLQRGAPPGDLMPGEQASEFFSRLYRRALHGYLSHPSVWMRIGFMGASFPEGYVWVNSLQVRRRRERMAGWDRL